ncbi:MAG TPA: hypothetical protein VM409_03965, partial [Chloroflexia bacterium]|nr:hypothetical protein [Chloroflexia bacterium]
IDTPPPEWLDRLLTVLSPAQARSFRAGIGVNQEGITYRQRRLSGRQVEMSGPLPDVPLVALFAGFGERPAKWPEGWPAAELDELLNRLQADLASRTPQGKMITAPGSGHYVHHHEPQLVIDTIRGMVDEIREKGV